MIKTGLSPALWFRFRMRQSKEGTSWSTAALLSLHFMINSFHLKATLQGYAVKMLGDVSECKQTALLVWSAVVSWKLLLFWPVQPKWAPTERLFIAKPLISCHDGCETNTHHHCMGTETPVFGWISNCVSHRAIPCLPPNIVVGPHPAC